MSAHTTAFAPHPLVPSVVRVVTSVARSSVGYSVRLAPAERPEAGFPTNAAAAPDRVPAAGRRPVRLARMPGDASRRKPGCPGTIERATINRVEVG
jgi:hypothetical protein